MTSKANQDTGSDRAGALPPTGDIPTGGSLLKFPDKIDVSGRGETQNPDQDTTPSGSPEPLSLKQRRQRYEQRKQLEGYRKVTLRFPEGQRDLISAFIQELGDIEAEGLETPSLASLRRWLKTHRDSSLTLPVETRQAAALPRPVSEATKSEGPSGEDPSGEDRPASGGSVSRSNPFMSAGSPGRFPALKSLFCVPGPLIPNCRSLLSGPAFISGRRHRLALGMLATILILGLGYVTLPIDITGSVDSSSGPGSSTRTGAVAASDRLASVKELMQAEQAGYDAALRDIDMILEERRVQEEIPKRPD